MTHFQENLQYLLQKHPQKTSDFGDLLGDNQRILPQQLLDIADTFDLSIDDLLRRNLAQQHAIAKRIDIRFLVLDVDGTLTDGGMIFTAHGDEIKRFDAKDGRGIINTIKAGIPVGLLSSGLNQPLLEHRAKILGIKHLFAAEADKLTVLKQWCNALDISLQQVAYIGDDVNDLNVMQYVGLSACPSDAVDEIRAIAHVLLTKKGGQGCVREFIDLYLKQT